MKQVSAIERLRSLPPLFRGSDLTVRNQWTSKTASQYLYLWSRRGYVVPLGGHSDVFANVLMGERVNWEQALRMAMPSAVLVGVEALRRAGWTTQVPVTPTAAVRADQPVYRVNPFAIEARGRSWFATVLPGLPPAEPAALPVLAPAWALADLLRTGEWGSFGLWPDDIEWSELSAQDEIDWEQALAAFGLERPDLGSLAVPSR